jgi:ElaA protein
LLLYLRLVDPGMKYAEPSLGRVVCAAQVRGQGLGRALFAEGLRRCLSVFPDKGVRISAQAHLAELYGGFGFQPSSEPYLEDDIPHLEMWRPA